jgi:hypothetical protein
MLHQYKTPKKEAVAAPALLFNPIKTIYIGSSRFIKKKSF